jgi:hypothetical protein
MDKLELRPQCKTTKQIQLIHLLLQSFQSQGRLWQSEPLMATASL